jgi:5'-3' exonuclease
VPDLVDVHLVDGTWELFRAYHGAPRAAGRGGREVGAVRGLVRSLSALLRTERASHVAVAFDHVIESFRNGLYAGYKTSAGVPEELLAQFEPAEEAARALGLRVWSMVEEEADDALATGADRLSRLPEVGRVILCTPDKDLAQCVRGRRVVRLDRLRGKILDEDGVRERFGISPASIPDWLALVGDAADGYPGVPRWGERSASAVLARWPHLEDIPAAPAAWEVPVRGAAALAASLSEHRQEARLFRTLATLRTDAAVAAGLDELRWRGPDQPALAALESFLREEGLAARLPAVP